MVIMAVIRATCPQHKDVELERNNLTVHLDMAGRTDAFYRYTCPVDKKPVTKFPSASIIELLVNNECRVEFFDSEIPQADKDEHLEKYRTLGHITFDEIIDFGLMDIEQFNQAVTGELQTET